MLITKIDNASGQLRVTSRVVWRLEQGFLFVSVHACVCFQTGRSVGGLAGSQGLTCQAVWHGCGIDSCLAWRWGGMAAVARRGLDEPAEWRACVRDLVKRLASRFRIWCACLRNFELAWEATLAPSPPTNFHVLLLITGGRDPKEATARRVWRSSFSKRQIQIFDPWIPSASSSSAIFLSFLLTKPIPARFHQLLPMNHQTPTTIRNGPTPGQIYFAKLYTGPTPFGNQKFKF
uniref:Uncharacterized protein n=1 Tax=Sphaerodactylus townsendi TaxID=933632 RepID=A0ACB8FJT7_9SAUR